MRQADRIREYVLENYIEPARDRGDRFITIRAGDVGKAMGLLSRMPAIASALKARKFESYANVELVDAKGPHQGSNLYLTYKLLRRGEVPSWRPRAGVGTGGIGSRQETIRRMQERVERLAADFDRYIREFDDANLFTGPSLHFHLKTIATLRKHALPSGALDDDRFFELLYATLASWGMHRMGRAGAKLVDLPEIVGSFVAQRPAIESLEKLRLSQLSEEEVPRVTDTVWEVMESLSVGRQKVKLIANSKALHHLLPELVPPIDRQYILKFFYNNTNINRAEDRYFNEMFPHFHHVARTAESRLPYLLGRRMHTSETKIIDNAIVGFVLAELT